jgi:hypothetical protein
MSKCASQSSKLKLNNRQSKDDAATRETKIRSVHGCLLMLRYPSPLVTTTLESHEYKTSNTSTNLAQDHFIRLYISAR